MALSTGMATTGGAAVALNPGTALGGNALAAQQTFNSFGPPPSMGPTPDATEASHGGGRAGGAYDMRSWEQGGDVYEDLLACLGVDVGTSTIKACVYLRDGGCKAVGKNPLPACLLLDPKSGVKGVRRWLKARVANNTPGASPAPPKGITLFHEPSNRSSNEDRKHAIIWPLRLLALRGNSGEAVERVESSLRHKIKISPEESQDAEDADSSGVRILLKSPNAPEAKDREVWVTAEEVLAILLAGVRAKAEEAHNVTLVTCNMSAPACLGDLQRVALQRSIFLAGMAPGRFVGGPLAAAVGYMWGRSTSELKKPDDLVLSVGMGSSFLDVALLTVARESRATSSDEGNAPVPASATTASTTSSGKKRKGKGGSAKDETGAAMTYKVKAVCGDTACGGLDMDYRVARALLAAVEDASGHEIASDRALWLNLLDAAELMRERLTTDPKWSYTLKPGCSEQDPTFRHTVEMSQNEMEDTVAGTIESFRAVLQLTLEQAGASPGQVKSIVLYGLCTNTPAMHNEILKTFPDAQISQAAPGDCAKGAALLLAGERDLLSAVPVKAEDSVAHKLGLVDRSKGSEPIELFPTGSPFPGVRSHEFNRKNGSGLAADVEVVQWVEPCGSGFGRRAGRKRSGGKWVTVQRLGNPLTMQDDRGYPVLAEEVTMRFSLDKCGICVNEVESSVLPKKRGDPGPVRRFLNKAAAVLSILAVLGGGYYLLRRLEHAPERRQAKARIRLTAFYEENNPEKLASVEETLRRYQGREDVMFDRIKKQYGKPVPHK